MSETALIDSVLDHHRRDGTRLVQILRETQERIGWLSPATLTHIADAVGWPRAMVSGTASFYSFFHTRPRGRYCVLWSDNITDRMLGNTDLMAAMCKKLWLEPGRVSEDGLVSVNTTSCTGMCDQGPALLVNYRAVTGMTLQRVNEMAELIRNETPVAEWPAEWFAVQDNVRRAEILLAGNFAPAPRCAPPMNVPRSMAFRRRTTARSGSRCRTASPARWPCSTKSSAPSCAGAAAPAFPPASSGKPAATHRCAKTRNASWSAMPTRASRAPSRTACC
jgi:NADH:ubiquinone oxidoreductase subunit E